MFKNVLKIGMLAAALAFGSSAIAQEKTYAPEYPQYGFWSNWSLGLEGSLARQAGTGGLVDGLGLTALAEKELNHVWDLRFRVGVPAIRVFDDGMRNMALATAGFKFGIIDACKGYNPDRKGNLYVAVDGGFAPGREHKLGLCLNGGAGFEYRFCEKSSLYVEADLQPRWWVSRDLQTFYAFARLGYLYHFGATAADKELIAQRALVTQENVDNLNTEIARLNNEVASGKQAEKKLQNNIADLEDRLAQMTKDGIRNGKSDSLAKVIDQIKADQLNYYALPFSVLYAVDQWRVPADQDAKVKAIARVIKDTEGARFKVVGFCDKSGSDAYNMQLSQKRAEELKRVLVEKYGIAEDRIDVDYKGKGMAFGDISYSVNRRTSVYRVIE